MSNLGKWYYSNMYQNIAHMDRVEAEHRLDRLRFLCPERYDELRTRWEWIQESREYMALTALALAEGDWDSAYWFHQYNSYFAYSKRWLALDELIYGPEHDSQEPLGQCGLCGEVLYGGDYHDCVADDVEDFTGDDFLNEAIDRALGDGVTGELVDGVTEYLRRHPDVVPSVRQFYRDHVYGLDTPDGVVDLFYYGVFPNLGENPY